MYRATQNTKYGPSGTELSQTEYLMLPTPDQIYFEPFKKRCEKCRMDKLPEEYRSAGKYHYRRNVCIECEKELKISQ